MSSYYVIRAPMLASILFAFATALTVILAGGANKALGFQRVPVVIPFSSLCIPTVDRRFGTTGRHTFTIRVVIVLMYIDKQITAGNGMSTVHNSWVLVVMDPGAYVCSGRIDNIDV